MYWVRIKNWKTKIRKRTNFKRQSRCFSGVPPAREVRRMDVPEREERGTWVQGPGLRRALRGRGRGRGRGWGLRGGQLLLQLVEGEEDLLGGAGPVETIRGVNYAVGKHGGKKWELRGD